MKRGVLALALVTTLAGVASAHIISTPVPKAGPTPTTPSKMAAVSPAQAEATASPTSTSRVHEASAVTVNPPTKPRDLEPRQEPIPLQVSTKPTYVAPVAPSVDVAVPVAKPAPDSTPKAAKESSPKGPKESTAKSAIETDGYKGVRDLTQAPDGTWRGRAMRGNTEIAVTVDAKGQVSAD